MATACGKLLSGLLAITTIVLASASLTFASVTEDKAREAKSTASQFESDLIRIEKELRNIPVDDWEIAEVQSYLGQALSAIYFAKMAANWSSPSHASQTDHDLSQLVALGYLKVWPANPFNNWEPMRTLTLGEGFNAGDLVLQTAPSSHFSKLHGQLYAVSFCLGIYGPAPEFREVGVQNYLGKTENAEWVQYPKDVIFVKSMWLQSHASVEARKKWQKEREERGKTENK